MDYCAVVFCGSYNRNSPKIFRKQIVSNRIDFVQALTTESGFNLIRVSGDLWQIHVAPISALSFAVHSRALSVGNLTAFVIDIARDALFGAQ